MNTEVDTLLDQLSTQLEQARALPMSASCVVNREELLALVDDVRGLLPSALARADRVLRDRETLLEQGREQAQRIVVEAEQEQDRLVEATAVFNRAQAEADRLLQQARDDAEAMRLQTEDYVEAKLANFEVVLTKTLATVQRGRSRLSGRTDLEDLRSHDPVRESDGGDVR